MDTQETSLVVSEKSLPLVRFTFKCPWVNLGHIFLFSVVFLVAIPQASHPYVPVSFLNVKGDHNGDFGQGGSVDRDLLSTH